MLTNEELEQYVERFIKRQIDEVVCSQIKLKQLAMGAYDGSISNKTHSIVVEIDKLLPLFKAYKETSINESNKKRLLGLEVIQQLGYVFVLLDELNKLQEVIASSIDQRLKHINVEDKQNKFPDISAIISSVEANLTQAALARVAQASFVAEAPVLPISTYFQVSVSTQDKEYEQQHENTQGSERVLRKRNKRKSYADYLSDDEQVDENEQIIYRKPVNNDEQISHNKPVNVSGQISDENQLNNEKHDRAWQSRLSARGYRKRRKDNFENLQSEIQSEKSRILQLKDDIAKQKLKKAENENISTSSSSSSPPSRQGHHFSLIIQGASIHAKPVAIKIEHQTALDEVNEALNLATDPNKIQELKKERRTVQNCIYAASNRERQRQAFTDAETELAQLKQVRSVLEEALREAQSTNETDAIQSSIRSMTLT